MRYIYFIGLIVLLTSSYSNLLANNLDSLVRAIEEEQQISSEEVARNLLSLGKMQIEQKGYDAALKTFQKSINYSTNDSLIIEAHRQLGITYQKLDQPKLALENYLEILKPEYSIFYEDPTEIYLSIAKNYLALGAYEKAYEFQMKVLAIAEKEDNLAQKGEVLYKIGSIFYYQGNLEQALDYYEKALVICEELDNKQLISTCLGAMGSCYGDNGNIEKSLLYNTRYLDIMREINYLPGIAYGLHNIASNYVALAKYGTALQYLEESLVLKEEINDKWAQISGLELIAEIYVNQQRFDVALATLDNALQLALEIDAKPRIQDIHRVYADAYAAIGDFKKAYHHLQSHNDIKDSIFNAKTIEEMGAQKSIYEIRKREEEILSLKKDNALLEKDQEISILYKIGFGVIISFLSLLILALLNRYRLQRQNFDLLEDKNEQIRLKNEALKQANTNQVEIAKLLAEKNELLNRHNLQVEKSNKKLSVINEELKQFASVASHDLKEPLRMIGSYTSLLKRRYVKDLDSTAQEFMGYVTDATGRMENLLDDLLAYSRVGTQEVKMEKVDLNNTLTIVNANLHRQLAEAEAKLEVELGMLPAIKGSNSQMIQLFQNLVSNGVKFRGERKPVVKIECTERGGYHLIKVKDNGIGIAPEYQDKIFEMFRRLHTREEYEGTGIGLATCKKIVDRHAGKIWVESVAGEGSIFNIELPKMA